MATNDFETAKEKAQKILGDDAKMPKLRIDMEDLWSSSNDAWEELEEARGTLQDKILAYENAVDGIKNGLKQAAAAFEKADFDLDEKNKDNQKKIKQAQKIFSDYFASEQSDAAKAEKVLDELEKHVAQLDKYKNPSK